MAQQQSRARYFAPKVYWGGARREDVENAFGKAFPPNGRIFFAWKRSGWKEAASGRSATYEENLVVYWAEVSDRLLFGGVAMRRMKKKEGLTVVSEPWKYRHASNRSEQGFNPDREFGRVARYIDHAESGRTPDKKSDMGMPVQVARGLAFALSRMIDMEEAWKIGLEEPTHDPLAPTIDEREGVEDGFGTQTPPVGEN